LSDPRIQFSYPRTVEELLHQVASLHESCNTSPTPPSLVIVDGLEGFLRGCGGGGHSASHPGRPSSAAHLAALLSDSAVFLTQLLKQRCSSSAPCRVIASFAWTAGGVARLPLWDRSCGPGVAAGHFS
uniref:SWIM-type zinc finger 7 associated protein 1 n=1 Tax=Sander lucioperca TaxID=283035 RepID=A0A8D0AE29_SANLU